MLTPMSNAVAAAVAGGTVGLAVAMPLGPVGLAVVASGQRGWRAGMAAATGVATADLIWAAVAASGGAAVAASPAIAVGQLIARLMLIAVGAALVLGGIRRLRAHSRPERRGPAARNLTLSPLRRYLAMLAVTLPNPLTVAVFTAATVEAGLVPGSGSPPGVWLVATFATAAGTASLGWQLLLAAAGRRLAVRARPAPGAWLAVAAGIFLVVWPLLN
jgi:threonine/homoserine/homoserine lactone efflux protein